MKKSLRIFWISAVSLCCYLLACNSPQKALQTDDPIFRLVSSDKSGLHFANQVLENDTLNYYTFPYLFMGGGVALGDINQDGLSDIFITGNMVPNRLYLNKGNLQFEDISESAGIMGDDRWYTGVSMLDINQDGWLDIYVCVSGKYGPFENQLYINNRDQTFSEGASKYGLNDNSTSIQATSFDYNQDGLLDLFVANYPQLPVSMGRAFYAQKMQQNRPKDSGHLYQNMGNGRFEDVTTKAGLQNFGLTLGVVASDLNQDGWTDLYLSNDFNVPDYLYLNNGDGTFSERLPRQLAILQCLGWGWMRQISIMMVFPIWGR